MIGLAIARFGAMYLPIPLLGSENPMETLDGWIFLAFFTGFSAVLFLVTVLVAQLETFVPSRRGRTLRAEPPEENRRPHHDEPTAA
jgi:hypothetical protein